MSNANKEIVMNLNVNLFMQNYLIINPQYLTNMLGTIESILSYFENDEFESEEEKKECSEWIADIKGQLHLMKYQPIKYIREYAEVAEYIKKETARKMPPDIMLSNLEWIQYREAHYKTKLKNEYLAGTGWRTNENKINFSDIIMINAEIKHNLYDILINILQKFEIDSLNITLPSLTPETTRTGTGGFNAKTNY